MEEKKKMMKSPSPTMFSRSWKKLEYTLNERMINTAIVKEVIETKGFPEQLPNVKEMRGMTWKLFLGFLPEDTLLWEEKEKMFKTQYQQSLDDFYYNIDYPKTKILNELQKDIKRIFPQLPFYQNEENTESVQRILFVNCVFNKSIQYVQGMHEMCALIFYVFSQQNKPKDIIEAESYCAFTTLIVRFRDWFDKAYDDKPTGLRECFKNIDIVFKAYEPDLWKHLNSFNLDLTCYSFRWVSMFFLDDYEVEDVIKIWDRLLCGFGSQQIYIEIISIAVAMIVLCKDKLMKMEGNECLRELMNVHHNVELVLKRATKIKKFIESKHIFQSQ